MRVEWLIDNFLLLLFNILLNFLPTFYKTLKVTTNASETANHVPYNKCCQTQMI